MIPKMALLQLDKPRLVRYIRSVLFNKERIQALNLQEYSMRFIVALQRNFQYV
jgi:hypothetical protein